MEEAVEPMPPRSRWASQDSGIRTALGLAIAGSIVLIVLGIVFASLDRSAGLILLILGAVSLATALVVTFKPEIR
jgi:hypothetical protein